MQYQLNSHNELFYSLMVNHVNQEQYNGIQWIIMDYISIENLYILRAKYIFFIVSSFLQREKSSEHLLPNPFRFRQVDTRVEINSEAFHSVETVIGHFDCFHWASGHFR